MDRKGFFLVVEGIDGSGKTTQCKQLSENLKSQGVNVLSTSEPSEGSIGIFIRNKILLEGKYHPDIEALLFAADRFDHQQNVIIPALNKGLMVICDRYLYASLAYQGAQGVKLNWIRTLNYFTLKPDLALYLDIPPEEALARKKGIRDSFENLELEEKVSSIYLDLVEKGELTLVNGRGTIEEIGRRLYEKIKLYLS